VYLLFSTAALRAFDQQQYAFVALWGAIATATPQEWRSCVLWCGVERRRPAIAYAAGLAAGGGLLLFSLYCAIHFGDPLAFVQDSADGVPRLGLLAGLVEDADANFSWHDELEAWLD